MKDSIKYKIAVLIAVPVMYYFLVSGFRTSETNTTPQVIINNPKDFTNCIFNPEYQYVNDSRLYIENNLDKFWDELHFNAIQWYDFGGSEKYGMPGETLNANQIEDYKTVLRQVSNKPLKGFYEKCNFAVPMYGQRLVYEIQGTPDNNDLNYGFVYQTCMQNIYTTDQGRTVLHPRPGIDQPGYLCRNIYENFQHTDLFDFRQNDKGTWYIKPVMKIPTGIQTDLPVVTIQVISFDNDQVKSITISSDDFKDQNGNYNGEYKSEYLPLLDLLQIEGDNATDHLNQGRIDENWNWPTTCHVDFRVLWEGQVEVWFDKMVVDDQIANRLFNPDPGVNYNYYIEQQAREFTNYYSYYTFYTDEICISQIPCIKYVMKRMREVTPEYGTDTPKFCIALSNNLHVKGLRNDNLSYKYFFDSLDVERVQMDIYKFNSSIPNVFPVYDTRIPSGWLKTPIEYNTWLQNILGDRNLFEQYTDGSFVYQLNKIRTDSKQYSPNTLLILVPQLHSWLNSNICILHYLFCSFCN